MRTVAGCEQEAGIKQEKGAQIGCQHKVSLFIKRQSQNKSIEISANLTSKLT